MTMREKKEPHCFQVGDIVEWESQSRANRTRKKGIVLAVVPAYRDPWKFAVKATEKNAELRYDGVSHRIRVAFDGVIPRGHESYLVGVVPSARSMTRLYWPRTSWLSKAEGEWP